MSQAYPPQWYDAVEGQGLLDQLRAGKEPRLVRTRHYDYTLTHYACQQGWLEFAQCVIEEHKCDPYARSWGGQTPLHQACLYGHIDIVCYLISVQHCDTNCHDNYQRAALHWLHKSLRQCTKEDAVKITQFLVSIASCHVDRMVEYGYTTFLLACKQGNTRLARSLIAEGHCDVTTNGDTALHIACHHGRGEMSCTYVYVQCACACSLVNYCIR